MTDQKKEVQSTLPEKCVNCYLKRSCMLTEAMQKKCGGPWKDHAAHLKYVEKEVMEKKKPSS